VGVDCDPGGPAGPLCLRRSTVGAEQPGGRRTDRRRALTVLAAAVATTGYAAVTVLSGGGVAQATEHGAVRRLAGAPDAGPAGASATPPGPAPVAKPSGPAPAPGDTAPMAQLEPSGVPRTAAPTPLTQLTAGQLPAAQTEQWSSVGSPSTRPTGGHAIVENECARISGADTWTQQGFSGAGEENVAVEDAFSFASPAAARAAYAAFAPAMKACQATTRALQGSKHIPPDAAVHQTAALPAGLAWERTWTGAMGLSAPGPQTNHIYIAVSGAQVTVLQFTEFPGKAAAYAVSGDHGVLTKLTGEPAG